MSKEHDGSHDNCPSCARIRELELRRQESLEKKNAKKQVEEKPEEMPPRYLETFRIELNEYTSDNGDPMAELIISGLAEYVLPYIAQTPVPMMKEPKLKQLVKKHRSACRVCGDSIPAWRTHCSRHSK